MSTKTVHVETIGDVVITKRKGQRTIRVSVNGNTVKVSQPSWLPFSAGEKFIEQRLDWIKEHVKPELIYSTGSRIGRNRSLYFERANRATIGSRISSDRLTVLLPQHIYPEDSSVQHYIQKKLVTILRSDGEDYLPHRVSELAKMFGFEYRSVQIKQLKRRWGSCNSKKELVFNLNLMELDSLHIDYVILHELTHTIYMNHGPEFWAHMESVMPNSRRIARDVRHYSM
jgi:predicted metal-dependent hydrolase